MDTLGGTDPDTDRLHTDRQFAPAIQRWLANVFIDIIVLALTFAAGWLLGRYGGKRNRNRDQENARNITEAQKR